ncbi:hypothetical protein G7Y89_g32 [Cudoniella acicularis]|uniref:WSC domain-containing protein n=1 Tax=Cudoniella acicularis TaxID=354080 RepID=A0A8H4RXZ5_9HELO|nr:hypothetical protein G7Y89_g32 [Cudoniella acicularis]
MQCSGNPLEYCGAGRRLNVCAKTVNVAVAPGPEYTYYGCQTEVTNMQALNAKMSAYDTMTVESCQIDCVDFRYYGLEYGRECYWGNSFNYGSVPAPSTDFAVLCQGDASEICGNGLRLSIYELSSLVGTPDTTPPPALAGLSNKATVGGYDFLNCMSEATNARALQGASTADDVDVGEWAGEAVWTRDAWGRAALDVMGCCSVV